MSGTVGVILIIVGLLHLAFPYASWFLSIGWKIRDAEPSDAYLTLTRIGGGLAAGIGVIVLIVAFVHASAQASHQRDGFEAFVREMTVKNISTIEEQNGPNHATPTQIQEFVQDIHEVDSPYSPPESNSFAAMGSFTIICRDGYQASLINVDNNGTIGIATGTAWLFPDYEFTSETLNEWTQQIGATVSGGRSTALPYASA